MEAVFNQTVSIVELDEGMDGETFFLYVFLLAFSVLLLVAGHHFLSSFGRKKGSKKAVVEVGTSKRDDVDYDWLPKEVLNEISKYHFMIFLTDTYLTSSLYVCLCLGILAWLTPHGLIQYSNSSISI